MRLWMLLATVLFVGFLMGCEGGVLSIQHQLDTIVLYKGDVVMAGPIPIVLRTSTGYDRYFQMVEVNRNITVIGYGGLSVSLPPANITIEPVLKDGLLSFLMEGIVELLESLTYYVSNSVSFLRVAAFAMAHAVLSVIVFELSAMLANAPGGVIFQALIILIGNLIIIVLEGLIVTIQVIRLQYYEFFSKFFTATGEAFTPFTLHPKGGSS